MGPALSAAVAPRTIVRSAAMAMATLAAAWGLLSSAGLAAALAGAALGVIVGEIAGRSRLRLAAIVVGLSVLVVSAFELARLGVTSAFAASQLGIGATLKLSGVLRYGMLALAVTSALRATSLRRPTALALEIAVVAAAFTSAFASHRDGVIARPLWLSDWAWQQGIDPADVLLGIGGGAVLILAVLLITDRQRGWAFSALFVVPGLALLVLLLLDFVGRPTPSAENDLGLTNPPPGEPPREMPPSERDHGQGGADGGGQRAPEGRDGGARPQDGDGGGARPQDAGADGGDRRQGNQPDGGQGEGQSARTPEEQLERQQQQSRRGAAAPMAVVLLDDDYSPPSQAYYFRQEAWSEYNGSRLVATSRPDADLDTFAEFPTAPTPARSAPPSAGRVRVGATVAMLVEHTRPFALETPIALGPVGNPNPARFVRAYRFDSLSQQIDFRGLSGRRAGEAAWSPELSAYYTRGPTDPRYAELARRIITELPGQRSADPFLQALAIKIYLDRNLIYSTRHRHSEAADPTADFLFGDRTGYCVHFAHSAVYLWRSLGIPARIGTGYHSDEENRRGGSAILIRSSDAHAWPELYLDGFGWVVLDISAERNLDPPATPTDDDLQRLLGEMARAAPQNPMQPPPPRESTNLRRLLKPLGWGVIALAALALAAFYLIKLWRRLAPALSSRAALPRVGYRAALDRLAEAGLARRFGETREDFAVRAARLCPTFPELTAMHVAARLRDPAIAIATRPELEPGRWRSALAAVRSEIARAVSLPRRLLGLVDPLSFFQSR